MLIWKPISTPKSKNLKRLTKTRSSNKSRVHICVLPFQAPKTGHVFFGRLSLRKDGEDEEDPKHLIAPQVAVFFSPKRGDSMEMEKKYIKWKTRWWQLIYFVCSPLFIWGR